MFGLKFAVAVTKLLFFNFRYHKKGKKRTPNDQSSHTTTYAELCHSWKYVGVLLLVLLHVGMHSLCFFLNTAKEKLPVREKIRLAQSCLLTCEEEFFFFFKWGRNIQTQDPPLAVWKKEYSLTIIKAAPCDFFPDHSFQLKVTELLNYKLRSITNYSGEAIQDWEPSWIKGNYYSWNNQTFILSLQGIGSY